MAGLSGASGRRCGIYVCVVPDSLSPTLATDRHTPWPRLLVLGAWLVSWSWQAQPDHRILYRMYVFGQGESPAK